MTLRLQWDRTYPENANRRGDFTARHPDNPQAFVRIYVSQSHDARGVLWYWTASDGEGVIGRGSAETTNEAARLAEEALLGPV